MMAIDITITKYNFIQNLACIFYFPNAGHEIVLLRTVSFKFRLIHLHMYA